MELINFDECKRPESSVERHYGGMSGYKEHVLIDGKNYFLKYPDNLREKRKQMTNIVLSYSIAPVSEYLGSKVYEILDIPVHETILGISKEMNHVVVACRDFKNKGDYLDEFGQINVSSLTPDRKNGKPFGNGSDLEEIVEILQNSKFLKSIDGLEERFWQMFVVDAFIGNGDRNNGNWGIIRCLNESNIIAPVYDNGASFNNKWDAEKLRLFLSNKEKLYAEAYKGKTCYFTKVENEVEKKLNPFKIINSGKYMGLSNVVQELVPKIGTSMQTIFELIDNIPSQKDGIEILSDLHKTFYKKLLDIRYNKAFLPALNKIQGRGNGIDFRKENDCWGY